MSAPSQDDLAAFARAEELQAALHRAQRALAEEKRRKDDLAAAVYRAARDAALGQPSPHPIERPRKGKPGQHALLLHLTDWQLGKRTDSYNSDICASRVRQAVEKAMRLVDLHRHAYPVTSAALLLGGDLVEGVDIFPGQAYQVDSGLFEQVFAAAAVVEGAVRTLLREFQDVLVVEEYGNHGRLGRKGELRAEDNTDRMAARIARDRIGQQRGLTWQASGSWHQVAALGNYRFLLVHGDEVKQFGGNIPAFGISRKSTAWASGVVEPFTDVYMGHFHRADTYQLPNGGRVFLTPSPESGNEYAAETLAATGKPGQRAHFVDLERGRVAAEYLLWLD